MRVAGGSKRALSSLDLLFLVIFFKILFFYFVGLFFMKYNRAKEKQSLISLIHFELNYWSYEMGMDENGDYCYCDFKEPIQFKLKR